MCGAMMSDNMILFVDDEELLLKLGQKILQKIGFCVTTALDPLEALLLLKENPTAYKLIITDMSMPNINGIQLADEAIKIVPNIPIILCTGYSDMSVSDLESDSIKKILPKPISKNDLVDSVHQFLGE